MKFLILVCVLVLGFKANATLSTNKYEGKDNYGNACFMTVLNMENTSGPLKDHKLHVQLNYLPQDLILTHPTEIRTKGPVYVSNAYNLAVPKPNVEGVHFEYTINLELDADENPVSFNYFDNTGSGFKRRYFNCVLNP